MPATRRLVLDLPAEQADRIEAEVAAGRYASAGAYVSARLAEEDALPSEHEGLDWESLVEGAQEQERRIASGEEVARPAEQVCEDLERRIRARAAARRVA